MFGKIKKKVATIRNRNRLSSSDDNLSDSDVNEEHGLETGSNPSASTRSAPAHAPVTPKSNSAPSVGSQERKVSSQANGGNNEHIDHISELPDYLLKHIFSLAVDAADHPFQKHRQIASLALTSRKFHSLVKSPEIPYQSNELDESAEGIISFMTPLDYCQPSAVRDAEIEKLSAKPEKRAIELEGDNTYVSYRVGRNKLLGGYEFSLELERKGNANQLIRLQAKVVSSYLNRPPGTLLLVLANGKCLRIDLLTFETVKFSDEASALEAGTFDLAKAEKSPRTLALDANRRFSYRWLPGEDGRSCRLVFNKLNEKGEAQDKPLTVSLEGGLSRYALTVKEGFLFLTDGEGVFHTVDLRSMRHESIDFMKTKGQFEFSGMQFSYKCLPANGKQPARWELHNLDGRLKIEVPLFGAVANIELIPASQELVVTDTSGNKNRIRLLTLALKQEEELTLKAFSRLQFNRIHLGVPQRFYVDRDLYELCYHLLSPEEGGHGKVTIRHPGHGSVTFLLSGEVRDKMMSKDGKFLYLGLEGGEVVVVNLEKLTHHSVFVGQNYKHLSLIPGEHGFIAGVYPEKLRYFNFTPSGVSTNLSEAATAETDDDEALLVFDKILALPKFFMNNRESSIAVKDERYLEIRDRNSGELLHRQRFHSEIVSIEPLCDYSLYGGGCFLVTLRDGTQSLNRVKFDFQSQHADHLEERWVKRFDFAEGMLLVNGEECLYYRNPAKPSGMHPFGWKKSLRPAVSDLKVHVSDDKSLCTLLYYDNKAGVTVTRQFREDGIERESRFPGTVFQAGYLKDSHRFLVRPDAEGPAFIESDNATMPIYKFWEFPTFTDKAGQTLIAQAVNKKAQIHLIDGKENPLCLEMTYPDSLYGIYVLDILPESTTMDEAAGGKCDPKAPFKKLLVVTRKKLHMYELSQDDAGQLRASELWHQDIQPKDKVNLRTELSPVHTHLTVSYGPSRANLPEATKGLMTFNLQDGAVEHSISMPGDGYINKNYTYEGRYLTFKVSNAARVESVALKLPKP